MLSDRDMKLCLICLKTNQTNALSISNEAEQMICPLKQIVDDAFIFFRGGHVQEKSCLGFLFLLLKVLI